MVPGVVRELEGGRAVRRLPRPARERQEGDVSSNPHPRCARGDHDWCPVAACCRRAGCPATLTLGLFGAEVAREVDGWSAEGAGAGLEGREEREGQRSLWGDA